MTNKIEQKEKAVLVLSGKLLDKPFDLDSIAPLLHAVESSLSDRDVITTRRIVTLSDAHAEAAPYFLRAGFEAVPADDEDMHAAALMIAIVSSEKPDELVFALGESEPIQFLRLLAGKTRRVLLTNEKLEDGEKFLHNVEGILETNDLLNKAGVNPSQLRRVSWSERANEKGEGSLKQPTIKPVDETGARVAAPRRQKDEIDALCQTTEYDPYEDLKASAEEWNGELETLLLEANKTYPAAQAVEILDRRYPGIYRLYLDDRDEFRKLLDENKIRLIEEDERPTFYHATHPEMQPADLQTITEAVYAPTTEPGRVEVPDHFDEENPDASFKEIADKADILSRQCSWSAERIEIMKSDRGYDFELDVSPKDRELEREAEEADRLFLWPLNRKDPNIANISVDDLRKMARRYEFLCDVFTLLDQVWNERSRLDRSFVFKGLQIGVDAQCLVKTGLVTLGVSLGKDPVQRSAFKFLSDCRNTLIPAPRLENMNISDLIDFNELPTLMQRVEEYREEFKNNINKTKLVDKELGKLKFLCERITSANPQNDYDFERYNEDWESVVKTVTTLCQKYGEPYSSLRLRERLISSIDAMPDEIETTDEFARVCQEIDFFRMTEKENAEAVDEYDDAANYSEDVLAVRRHYEGAKAVFVGGSPTPHIRERLARAFGFELIWDEHNHGDSLDRFNGALNSSEVKLFMVYIPWCSHKHSRELKELVEKSGKDFVRLRKGTSPEQIANTICSQIDMKDDELLFSAMQNAEPLGDDE